MPTARSFYTAVGILKGNEPVHINVARKSLGDVRAVLQRIQETERGRSPNVERDAEQYLVDAVLLFHPRFIGPANRTSLDAHIPPGAPTGAQLVRLYSTAGRINTPRIEPAIPPLLSVTGAELGEFACVVASVTLLARRLAAAQSRLDITDEDVIRLSNAVRGVDPARAANARTKEIQRLEAMIARLAPVVQEYYTMSGTLEPNDRTEADGRAYQIAQSGGMSFSLENAKLLYEYITGGTLGDDKAWQYSQAPSSAYIDLEHTLHPQWYVVPVYFAMLRMQREEKEEGRGRGYPVGSRHPGISSKAQRPVRVATPPEPPTSTTVTHEGAVAVAGTTPTPPLVAVASPPPPTISTTATRRQQQQQQHYPPVQVRLLDEMGDELRDEF